ncbi:DUF3576 domain-containing protein [Pelagibacteraceae bacterium]|nr:DUF3576 domain-containing protein [Pelagibacteraceae bacterium]
MFLSIFMKIFTKFYHFSILAIFILAFNSCGLYKKVDTRKTSTNANDRARAAVDEGRGLGIGNILGRKGGSFEFSSSNPMWRASIEILDFLPLSVVDYSGGMVITDWYSDQVNTNNSLKITVRFLSNEIRSDSLKIIVHEKKCSTSNSCTINILDSRLKEELLTSILKKAATLEKELKKKK